MLTLSAETRETLHAEGRFTVDPTGTPPAWLLTADTDALVSPDPAGAVNGAWSTDGFHDVDPDTGEGTAVALTPQTGTTGFVIEPPGRWVAWVRWTDGVDTPFEALFRIVTY